MRAPLKPSPPLPPEAFNATTVAVTSCSEPRRVLVTWYGFGPDEKGRRHFSLNWNDDYSVHFGRVPQKRGQFFFAKPSDHFVLDAGAAPEHVR